VLRVHVDTRYKTQRIQDTRPTRHKMAGIPFIESMDLKAIAGMHPTTACSACSSCSWCSASELSALSSCSSCSLCSCMLIMSSVLSVFIMLMVLIMLNMPSLPIMHILLIMLSSLSMLSWDPTGQSAVCTPSIERPVPLKLPRARAAAWIKSVADAAAAASVAHARAIFGARAEQRAA